MEKVTKINLASGRMYLKGYLNVDDLSMNPRRKVDIKADILTFKYKGKVDEILLCHFMMYLLPEDALQLFKRWYKWLKEGGRLVIETSHAQSIALMMIEDPKNVRQMFGYGATAGHKWSYGPNDLIELLKKAGFKTFLVRSGGLHNRHDRDFTIIATKWLKQ